MCDIYLYEVPLCLYKLNKECVHQGLIFVDQSTGQKMYVELVFSVNEKDKKVFQDFEYGNMYEKKMFTIIINYKYKKQYDHIKAKYPDIVSCNKIGTVKYNCSDMYNNLKAFISQYVKTHYIYDIEPAKMMIPPLTNCQQFVKDIRKYYGF